MNKVAIITGAGQGIGKTVAHRLVQDGFAVAIADINANSLDAVKKELEEEGGQALAIKADLTKIEDIQNVITRSAEWGQISVLVNNGGRVIITPFLDISENEWDAIMTLNLKTVFFATQFAVKR